MGAQRRATGDGQHKGDVHPWVCFLSCVAGYPAGLPFSALTNCGAGMCRLHSEGIFIMSFVLVALRLSETTFRSIAELKLIQDLQHKADTPVTVEEIQQGSAAESIEQQRACSFSSCTRADISPSPFATAWIRGPPRSGRGGHRPQIRPEGPLGEGSEFSC